MNEVQKSPLSHIGYVKSLFLLSGFAVALSFYRIFTVGNNRYWFLIWNLFLAWLPVLFAWVLYKKTVKNLYWRTQNILLFILWLLFLPNAFYLVSDFIHIHDSGEINLMFDVVLISTYALAGFVLGYTSLFLVHKRVLQRYGRIAHILPLIVLLLCGFAIYLGRYLRWNSWDVIANPFGLLFDVTSNIANPGEHALSFSTTLLFFAFLSVVYFVFWRGIQAAAEQKKIDK
jgi:uncharacterized membrane protein